jgi:di/tricarboxylate transporter
MTILKPIVASICLGGIAVALAGCDSDRSAPAGPHADASPKTDLEAGIDDGSWQTPRYVSVQLQPLQTTLVAGEAGRLHVEIRLKDAEHVPGGPLAWDRGAPPAIAWISTPQGSGISFVDKVPTHKPGQQILVKFAAPETQESDVLSASAAYIVNSRTKAGKHSFWFDLSVPLVTADGKKIQDMGTVAVPFEVDTHLRTKILMLLVVAVAVFLFIVEWVRVDVVAILMMVLLPELGLLDAQYTFRGLSSNAVVAIIGVMIISYGLNRVGLVSRMIQPLLGYVGKSTSRLAVVFSGLIAVISSVMQNTGAAVLFLPAIRLVAAKELKVPVSRVLMPIGMAAILGGTLTMVGTSPLILLNDLLPAGMPKFGFLELTPIGLALVMGGIVYLTTFGMGTLARLPVSQADSPTDGNGVSEKRLADSYPEIGRPCEVLVPDNYRPGEGPQEIASIRRQFQVNVVAIATEDGMQEVPPPATAVIRGGYSLCVYGTEEAVAKFVRDYGLVLRDEPRLFQATVLNAAIAGVVEVVVSPRSTLIGQTIKEVRFRETFDVTPLALHQDGETYYRGLADRKLQAGDALLLHGTWEQFHSLQERHQNFIIISSCEAEFQRPEKARWALGCFLGALSLMMVSSFYFQQQPYNPIPLSVCLMAGAVGMVLSKVMTITEAYRAVDWRTVFLLGGLIPLGMAVDQTGTAHWMARGIVVGLGDYMSPLLLLIVLACLSCGFTLVISNVGACTLLVPLGISLANQIGVDPRVAAIVVGIGVSNSFILPTHQVNALYMGPGGYRTKDYFKIGGGLSLIYITILVAMTYFFYV